jgi:ABC-type cobalamin/Fe3+-siderophores transport system ATPase subunit
MSLFPETGSSIVVTAGGRGAHAGPSAYHVRSLYFRYHAGRPGTNDWILDGLTFTVKAGEILGIAGPNGSGKTSLLKLLGKILRPNAGDVTLLNHDLAAMSQSGVARIVAVVPQESQQIFPFTVMETVLMGRYPHHLGGTWAGFGWESADDLAAARQVMSCMDITHLAHRVVTDLSGGERQRCLIARALAQGPQILLLDEPTAFLDLQHQVEICAILRRLNAEQGLTVVLVSHDLNLASQCCDRILMLKDGQLFRIGVPDEIITRDLIRAVYGCEVLVDRHPESGTPRVTLPGRNPAISREQSASQPGTGG